MSDELDAIRARRAALTTVKRRVQRYPHLGLDPETHQPIKERWTVVYEVQDPIWREPHLYIDGLAVSRADAEFDAAAPADIDTLFAEVERLRGVLADLFIPHDSTCPCYEGSAAELAQVRCICGAETTRAEIAAALGES